MARQTAHQRHTVVVCCSAQARAHKTITDAHRSWHHKIADPPRPGPMWTAAGLEEWQQSDRKQRGFDLVYDEYEAISYERFRINRPRSPMRADVAAHSEGDPTQLNEAALAQSQFDEMFAHIHKQFQQRRESSAGSVRRALPLNSTATSLRCQVTPVLGR